eukprot:scaffold7876_cov67-Isochrysis_galbana.AAC.1
MERTKFFPDSRAPTLVVWGWVKCSKDGEPMDLFAPAKGILGDFTWLTEYLESIASCENQAFPDWSGGWGCRSNLSKPTSFSQDQRTASATSIRAAFAYIVGLPPLNWSKPKLRELGVTGHSPHATLATSAGRLANALIFLSKWMPVPRVAFRRRIAAIWAIGPLWAATASSASAAADEDSEDEPEPPPAHFVPARRGRGRAGHVSRGSSPARGDMDLVYSRGEGRLGEETSQLAVRGRMSRIFRLAYAASDVDWKDLPDTKGE